jgi:FxsC-like protein
MYFFFSYSRQNNVDGFVRDFYKELNFYIQQSLGISTDAGFFDETGLEPGDRWEAKLEQALSSARVFLATLTAGYVKSEYCGKEWAAFESRVQSYAAKEGIAVPPLIIPVLWMTSAEPLPPNVLDLQYSFGNPNDDHNRKGLVRFYKLKPQYEVQRTDYIEALGQKIIKLYQENTKFDDVASVSPLASTNCAFSAKPPAAPPGQAVVKGPKRVHFVFGAGTLAEIPKTGRKDVSPYGSAGEEWRPFFPGVPTIESIALGTATQNGLSFYTGQMNFDGNLPVQVKNAREQRELVVIFVDSWTAALPQYRQILQDFDQQNYINCSVIVPWNTQDSETQTNKPKLEATLRVALPFRSGSQNDLYYRASAATEEDLRLQIGDVLTRLRADVINKSAPPPGVIDEAAGSRPAITGPTR